MHSSDNEDPPFSSTPVRSIQQLEGISSGKDLLFCIFRELPPVTGQKLDIAIKTTLILWNLSRSCNTNIFSILVQQDL